MTRFFRHEKRPVWGQGRLVADEDDRVRILFDDGTERMLLKSAPGLIELDDEEVSEDSSLRQESPREKKKKSTSSLGRLRPSTLIKSVRLAIRDAITKAKSYGAYPDDVMVEMQKGLSRITADQARFLNTKPAVVKKVAASKARELHKEIGVEALFKGLADRIEAVEARSWRWTRAYADPAEAAGALRKIVGYVKRASEFNDQEIEEFEKILCPTDLNPDVDD